MSPPEGEGDGEEHSQAYYVIRVSPQLRHDMYMSIQQITSTYA